MQMERVATGPAISAGRELIMTATIAAIAAVMPSREGIEWTNITGLLYGWKDAIGGRYYDELMVGRDLTKERTKYTDANVIDQGRNIEHIEHMES